MTLRKNIAIAAMVPMMLTACTTDPYTGEKKISKAAIGAAIGAGVGAIGGAVVGGDKKRKEVLIGAGIGAIVGGGVGAYMDAQDRKLREQLQGTGVQVVRDGDRIILNMPGNITFDTNSSNLQSDFSEVLKSVALVVKEYNKTYVDVLGHTDSTGSEGYNQKLSEARAGSVSGYLQSIGVEYERIIARGMGEGYPIADNSTEEGRAANRRVEIALSPVT